MTPDNQLVWLRKLVAGFSAGGLEVPEIYRVSEVDGEGDRKCLAEVFRIDIQGMPDGIYIALLESGLLVLKDTSSGSAVTLRKMTQVEQMIDIVKSIIAMRLSVHLTGEEI